MKAVATLIVILASTFTGTVYGESPNQFDYRLLPDKIVENTEGILQIHILKDGHIFPDKIQNLIVTSSESSIIQILGIEYDESNFMTNVKIKAIKAGTSKIAIAAPGFMSEEFSVAVYANKLHPVKMLMKVVPNNFLVDGPSTGYVSIELTDEDGFPTRAVNDVAITLSTSKNNVVNFENDHLLIKKGEYFTIGKFQVKQPDDVLIYASSETMETANIMITKAKTSSPLSVHLYVYPTKMNSFAGSLSYAIVQLQDSTGQPVIAKETIPISLKVSSADISTAHASEVYQGIVPERMLEIKKGSYLGYTALAFRGGKEGTFDISLSAKDLIVSGSIQIETKFSSVSDDKNLKLDMLPILATGKEELVGILHLEDDSSNPIFASKDLQIKIDSLDESSLSIKPIIMRKGFGVVPVFAKVGYSKPEQLSLHIVNNNEMVTPTVYQPDLKLVGEPLLPKILAKTDFPLAIYLLENNAQITTFLRDTNLSINMNDYVQIEPRSISKGESIVVLGSKSLKEGSTSISLDGDGFSTSVNIDSLSPESPTIYLDSPKTLIGNMKNTFSIQLLDNQLPVFAEKDLQIQLVSNDQSIIEVPKSVVIKKGEYYTFFEVNAKKDGQNEVAALASDFPLSKSEINVKNLVPDIKISSPDYINPNTKFDVEITAQYLGSPLHGMNVDWKVQGAEIENKEPVTDENGKSKITLVSKDPNKVDVQVDIVSSPFSASHVDKQIKVNGPLITVETQPSKPDTTGIFGINPILIVIPVAVAVGGIILKKKNMLDGVIEKINLADRVSEVKERLSQLREK